jgi:hypothetical protein
MITWTDVALLDPKLASIPNGAQTALLADVYLMLPVQRWGTKLDLGAKYLAAHMGTLYLRGGTGPGGPLTGEKLGPASRTYAAPRLVHGLWTDLDTTVWGLTFRRIARGLGALGGVSSMTNSPLNVPPDEFFDPWGGRYGTGS